MAKEPLFDQYRDVRNGQAIVADLLGRNMPYLQAQLRARATFFNATALIRTIGDMDAAALPQVMERLTRETDGGKALQVQRSADLALRRDTKYGKRQVRATMGVAEEAAADLTKILSPRGIYMAAARSNAVQTAMQRGKFVSNKRQQRALQDANFLANTDAGFDAMVDDLIGKMELVGAAKEGYDASKRHQQKVTGTDLTFEQFVENGIEGIDQPMFTDSGEPNPEFPLERAQRKFRVATLGVNVGYEDFVGELVEAGKLPEMFTDTGEPNPLFSTDVARQKYELFTNAWAISNNTLAEAADNGDIINFVGKNPQVLSEVMKRMAGEMEAESTLDQARAELRQARDDLEAYGQATGTRGSVIQRRVPRTALGRGWHKAKLTVVSPVVTKVQSGIGATMRFVNKGTKAMDGYLRRHDGYGGPIKGIPGKVARVLFTTPLDRIVSRPTDAVTRRAAQRQTAHNDRLLAKEKARTAPTRIAESLRTISLAAQQAGAHRTAAEAAQIAFGNAVAQDFANGFEPAQALGNRLVQPNQPRNPDGTVIWTQAQIVALGRSFVMRPYSYESQELNQGVQQTAAPNFGP